MIDQHRGQAKKGERPRRHPGDNPKNPGDTRDDPERKRGELILTA
jgi:hypothetical protein